MTLLAGEGLMRPLLRHLTQLVCLLMIDEFLLPPPLATVYVCDRGVSYTQDFPTTVSVYNISESFVLHHRPRFCRGQLQHLKPQDMGLLYSYTLRSVEATFTLSAYS